MNNGQKSLSINETFIIEGIEGSDVMSACTGFFTNHIISCSGDTEIFLGTGLINTNSPFSATTFYGDGSNLTGISTQDTFVTGGTYNTNSGVATFTNNTGGTFSVSGFYTGSTDVYVTAVTFTNNFLTLYRNDDVTFGATIDNFTSLNVNGAISATTFYGDGSNLTGISTQDTFVTGGTYSAGTAVFTNNTGGTFSVTGFSTSTATEFTGGTVTGSTIFTNGISANTISATTFYGDGSQLSGITVPIPTLQQVTDQPSGYTTTNPLIHTNGSNLRVVLDNDGTLAKLSFFDDTVYPASEHGIYAGFGFELNDQYGNVGHMGALVDALNNNIGFTLDRGYSTSSIKLQDGFGDTIGDSMDLRLPKGSFSGFSYGVLAISANGVLADNFGNLFVPVLTGGTYDNGTAVFTNNTGGTFNVSGFTTPFTGGTVAGLTATTISATTYLNLPKIKYIINVAKEGGDFTSIKDAVDSITGSDSENRYVVKVAPGQYVEDEIVLQGKEFISVVGTDILETLVVAASPNQNIFTLGNNNELSFMTISGASSGVALSCVDMDGFSLVHKLSIYDCDTNVLVKAENADSTFYGEYMDFNGEYSYGTKVLALNGFNAYANIENYYNYPTGTGTTIANHVQGSGSTLSVFVGDGIGNGVSGSTNYQILDYASLNTMSTTADNWDYGIRVLNIGGPSRFDIDSYSVVGSLSYDLSVEHPYAFGTFGGGSSTHNKINNLSDSVYWAFLDTNDGEFEVTRKISVTFQDGTHTDASTLIFEGSTMGLISGGTISYVSGLTVQVSAGFGYLEKTIGDEIYMRIDWNDTQITLSANSENYLYFNENNILSTSSNAPDNTTNIILGRVVTNSTGLRFIDETPYNASHTSNLLSTFNRNALGPIYANGSFVTENATPYHLNVSSGDYYFSENNFKPSGGTDIAFTQYHRDGSTGWITSATTQVINGYDNNSGSIVSLPLSAFTKHTLYVVGDGVNERYMLVVGQTYYTTLVEAEGADLPTPPTYFDDGVTTIASIIVHQGMSGITEILDIRPVIGFKAAGISATAVHGNLLGLNADDHQQYLLVDGSRAMTGNLSMGNNAISNALNVNGVVVESHASRHKNGGADEIASATPAPSEIPKADSFGKLDDWISDASTTVKGLTRLSQAPASASTPIAVGVNDPRFLSSISGVTNPTQSLVFTNNSGGTTSISNVRFSSVTATTISATTYQNLPLDIRVTGGTYSSSIGTTTFRNNTGGTFNVSGYFKPSDDVYVTGGTVSHGPNEANNVLYLYRTDNTTVTIQNLVDVYEISRDDLLSSVIADKAVINGKTYKVNKCDQSLYYNGTDSVSNPIYTTVYLMGVSDSKVSESGIGVFYTPNYSDISIFVELGSYIKDETVIWGGYVWKCKTTGTYSSVDAFTLDTNYWDLILPFTNSNELNTKDYTVRYNEIIYDIDNDKIIYRNEENTNIVSTTVEAIDYWITKKLFYNPIKAFQWGNVYDKDKGIGNQVIINSYNENINYTGDYQINFYFEGLSYLRNNFVEAGSSQRNFYFKDNSYQDGSDLTSISSQNSLFLTNNSHISNITLSQSYQDNIYLDNDSYMDSISITKGSNQTSIKLNNYSYFQDIYLDGNNSYQNSLFFNKNSHQTNITFGTQCYQHNLNFDNDSYQLNIDLQYNGKLANQEYFDFTNNSYQSNITIDSNTQQYFTFNNGYQNSCSGNKGQSYVIIENGSQINGFSDTQDKITIKGYDLDWGSYASIAQSGLFFIHDLPSEKTNKFIGKIENRLVEIEGLTYDGTQFVFTENVNSSSNLTFNQISASTYLGLPLDIRVTGGTYNSGTSTITFTNNTGGTFTVTGITATSGGSFTGGTVSGATIFTNGLTANTFNSTSILADTFSATSVSAITFNANSVSATTYNGYTPLPTQAASSTGVILSFITDTVYGTLATPETGTTISANTVNGQLGVTDIIIHSGGTAPTFSSQYKKLSGSGNYTTGQINYIFATYITSTEIIYAINQRT